MPYKIISSEPSEIVLERTSVWFIALVFGSIGIIFTIVGICMNLLLLVDSTDVPSLLFRILFPGMGLLFVFVGFSLPSSTKKTVPQRIRFDNRKGLVSIEMTNNGEQVGYIRYEEIEKFDLYTEARSSSNSTGKGMSRTAYYFHVLLKKKDGGEWFLTESGNRSESENIMKKLQQEVQLQNPSVLRSSPTFPGKVQKDETSGKTVVSWRNKVSAIGPLILVLFAVVFVTIVFSIFSSDGTGSEFSIFAAVIGSFMLIVFGIIAFVTVRSLIKDATTQYSVVIDRTTLDYQEHTKSGVLKKSRPIILSDIYCICYSYSPIKNYSLTGLRILTNKDFQQMEYYKEKPVEEFTDLFRKGSHGPLQLNITALNPVEFLQLENWLQELIKKKANLEVL